jgi:transposase-like protein
MVRPGRDRLTGEVEIDETYVGGLSEGHGRRDLEGKALVVIAAQKDGRKIGRIRLARVADASAESLQPFIKRAIEPDTVVNTDGWLGYKGLERLGYKHQVAVLRGQPRSVAAEVFPRVHLVASHLKRWLLGTHQGAVSSDHLDYYLDEFTFRFNRRTSRSRGKLFYRLMEQAAAIAPVHFKGLRPKDPNPLGSHESSE